MQRTSCPTYTTNTGVASKERGLLSVSATNGGFEVDSVEVVDDVVKQVTLTLSSISATINLQGSVRHVDLSELFQKIACLKVLAGSDKVHMSQDACCKKLLHRRIREPHEPQGVKEFPMQPYHQHNMFQSLTSGQTYVRGTADMSLSGYVSQKTNWKSVSLSVILNISVQLSFWLEEVPAEVPAEVSAEAPAKAHEVPAEVPGEVAAQKQTTPTARGAAAPAGQDEIEQAPADTDDAVTPDDDNGNTGGTAAPSSHLDADSTQHAHDTAAAETGVEAVPVEQLQAVPGHVDDSEMQVAAGVPSVAVLPVRSDIRRSSDTTHSSDSSTAKASAAGSDSSSSTPGSSSSSSSSTPKTSAAGSGAAASPDLPQPQAAAAAAAAESAVNHAVLLVGLKPARRGPSRTKSGSPQAAAAPRESGLAALVVDTRSPESTTSPAVALAASAAATAAVEDWQALAAAAKTPRAAAAAAAAAAPNTSR